jgi:hypothetical protein
MRGSLWHRWVHPRTMYTVGFIDLGGLARASCRQLGSSIDCILCHAIPFSSILSGFSLEFFNELLRLCDGSMRCQDPRVALL